MQREMRILFFPHRTKKTCNSKSRNYIIYVEEQTRYTTARTRRLFRKHNANQLSEQIYDNNIITSAHTHIRMSIIIVFTYAIFSRMCAESRGGTRDSCWRSAGRMTRIYCMLAVYVDAFTEKCIENETIFRRNCMQFSRLLNKQRALGRTPN